MIITKAEFISYQENQIDPLNCDCTKEDLNFLNTTGYDILKILTPDIKNEWFPYTHIIKDKKGRHYLVEIDDREVVQRISSEYKGRELIRQRNNKKAGYLLIGDGKDWEPIEPKSDKEWKDKGYEKITFGLANILIKIAIGCEFPESKDCIFWLK